MLMTIFSKFRKNKPANLIPIDQEDPDFEEREKFLFGTSKTNNDEFERNGYLVVRNFWDPNDLREEIDYASGNYQYNQFGKYTISEEAQVPGSRARHNYPPYKYFHSQARIKIQNIIGKELFNTYHYDRVYYANQELVKHIDRPNCEISATFQIGSNTGKSWPIWIKTPDTYDENKNIVKKGKDVDIHLNDGDLVIYKGVERPHWRKPLKSRYNSAQRFFRKIMGKIDDTYHHQLFFHYVLADGERCSFAGQR